MTPSLSKKLASLAAVLALVVLLPTATLAESTKVEGVIVERSGSEIIVEYMQGQSWRFCWTTARRWHRRADCSRRGGPTSRWRR